MKCYISSLGSLQKSLEHRLDPKSVCVIKTMTCHTKVVDGRHSLEPSWKKGTACSISCKASCASVQPVDSTTRAPITI
jgi:hypothetical protein